MFCISWNRKGRLRFRRTGRRKKAEISFCTEAQDYTVNVRDFGARGDGVQDDTLYIQAAIMARPKDSRVLIPEGVYRITSLFLKDHSYMELTKAQCFLQIHSVKNFRLKRHLSE